MIQNNSIRNGPLSEADLKQWDEDGYVLSKGLFDAASVEAIRDYFDAIVEKGEKIPGHWHPDPTSDDPVKRCPRVMHPHRFDAFCLNMMIKPEVGLALEQLLHEPAVGCQVMYFYKPPGSPGQALHQDNFYLAVKPGTCIAAWTAIDPVEPDNGGLYVVPGTHRMEIQCPDPEELEKTKRTNLVEPPPGMKAVPVMMEPGDTLFFNGSLVHGSPRNKTPDRWRRSFIGHYMAASSTHVSEAYFPIFDFAGNEVTYEAAHAGGPCGYAQGKVPNSYGVDAELYQDS